MLRIWGHPRAPNVVKVLWTCAELGLAYDLEPAGGPHGGLVDPSYLRLNPNGRIPTLDENGFVLWESHAIMRYLARREGAVSLYPAEPRAVALVDQWLDWQSAHLAQAVRDLVRLTVKADGPAPAGRLAAAEREADALFAIADGALRVSPHIAASAFSLADIPVAVAMRRWTTLPVRRASLPALEGWFARIRERSAAGPVLI